DPSHRTCTPFCTFDDTACVHTCGDGVRDLGEEQCDGADLGTKTCADFGYYRGALSCTSFCAFDSSDCEGNCGDDVVDAGEYCDGPSSPVTGYCTDFGYSTGQLTCSGLCGPSFSSCRAPTVWTDVLPPRHDFVELMPAPASTAWLIGLHELI